MALPSAWTESTLEDAMAAEVESVSAELGLDTLDVLATGVDDVAAILGVSSVADVTYASAAEVVKVRRIAAWIAWQKAYDVAITSTDLKAGSVSLTDSQAFDHLTKRLALAASAASVYPEVAAVLQGSSGAAVVGGMSTANSPYQYAPCMGW
jgi:hypothetical protein